MFEQLHPIRWKDSSRTYEKNIKTFLEQWKDVNYEGMQLVLFKKGFNVLFNSIFARVWFFSCFSLVGRMSNNKFKM